MRIQGNAAKGFLIALAVTLIPVSAVSAQKVTPGAACKVLNQKVTYLNKSYTCVKSGKKLVWNKVVVATKTTPAPTSIPTPSPTPTTTPIPILTPNSIPTPAPTPTADNLFGLADSVSLRAFQEIINYQNSQPDLPANALQLELSPNASKSLADATYLDLRKGTQFWQQYTGVSPNVHMIFADRKDLEWFKEKMLSIQPNSSSWLDRIYNLAKENPRAQYAGANGSDSQGKALFFFLPGTETVTNSPGWLGVGPHEWTHQAQYLMAGDISMAPCWFKEGQPTFVGNAISNNDLQNWAKHWKEQILGTKYDFPEFENMKNQELRLWLSKHELNMPNNVCGPDGAYIIGGIAVEYLVGSYGINGVNQFLLDIKKQMEWQKALQKLSGIPTDDLLNNVANFILMVRDWAFQRS